MVRIRIENLVQRNEALANQGASADARRGAQRAQPNRETEAREEGEQEEREEDHDSGMNRFRQDKEQGSHHNPKRKVGCSSNWLDVIKIS